MEINPYSIRFFVCFWELRYFSFLKYILGIILFNAISYFLFADDEIETTESPTAETPGNNTELDIDSDDELRADYLIEELLIAKLAVENNTMLSEMGHQFKDLVFDCNFRGNDCRYG